MKRFRIPAVFIAILLLVSMINTPVALAFGHPTGVKATALGSSSIKLTWKALAGTYLYTVGIGTSASNIQEYSFTENTVCHYTFKNLKSNTKYYFAVKACPYDNGGPAGSFSPAVSAKTKTGIAAPTGVSAASLSASQIKVKWNAVSGATKYVVYYSDDYRLGNFGAYYKTVTTTAKYKTISGLQVGKEYYFFVRAVNSKGQGYYSTIVAAFARPATPTGLKAVAMSSSSIKLTWQPAVGAGSYVIYRYNPANGSYENIGNVVASATPTYTDTGLKASTKYYYKVAAWNTGSSEKSNYAYATTKSP